MNRYGDHAIASHNSATGEKGDGLGSWIVTPGARCQSKTIREQWEAGCRMFDLRVRPDQDGILRPAHGLWMAKRSLASILEELDQVAFEDCWIGLCWEGHLDSKKEQEAWEDLANYMLHGRCRHLRLAWIAVKKPRWKNLAKNPECPGYVQVFHGINTDHWWTLLMPIPWVWKRLWRYRKPIEADKFVMDDFV